MPFYVVRKTVTFELERTVETDDATRALENVRELPDYDWEEVAETSTFSVEEVETPF